MTPAELLRSGARILEPILSAHGFRFRVVEEDRGSGGNFAVAIFVLPDRKLTLHFRDSLGFVTYDAGSGPLDHALYMTALHAPPGATHYPGFSSDPLDGFRHLAHDLETFASEFVSGNAAILREAAPRLAIKHEASTRAEFARMTDARPISEARRLFALKDYRAARKLLESVRYPESLTPAERRLLDLARERSS